MPSLPGEFDLIELFTLSISRADKLKARDTTITKIIIGVIEKFLYTILSFLAHTVKLTIY